MPAPIRSRAAAGWPWPLRAIQLDVARHLESVTYIRRFTDDAARLGFNTLVLYLEGRVRTPTFPFRPKDASYSLEDMAAVVGHARKAGLEVVPVVSTLGHAEQFLTCRELTHLAEERDGRGRFRNPTPFVFCLSKEETYAFFVAYFCELG